jgi:hypothetical protein
LEAIVGNAEGKFSGDVPIASYAGKAILSHLKLHVSIRVGFRRLDTVNDDHDRSI